MAGAEPQAKQAAMQWLEENDVMTVVEKAINEACRQTPKDINGFMAEYFKEASHAATIVKVPFARR